MDTSHRATAGIGAVKTISARFALLMAAAAVVPLLAYGGLSILSVRSGAQQAVILGNQNVARRVAEQIELYVTGNVKILKAVGADLQHTGLQRWQKDRILKNFVLDFPEITELSILDEHGQTVVSSRIGPSSTDIPGTESVNLDGALMSRFSLDDDLLPTSTVAVRLTEDGGNAWLLGRLSLEELWRMVDRIRIGEAGFALLVSNDGQLVAHGNPNEKSRVARRDNLGDHPLVAAVRDPSVSPGGAASSQYIYRDGTPMLGVAAYLPSLGWTIIVEQPVNEAFAIPISLQRQLGVAIAIALFAMLTVGYFWGRSFIDPILRLTRGTRALAEGRLDERVVVDSADELGQLGVAFNNMADRLVELQEDVKKKERQAMFGRVAVGLVHDLSNPIQNIGNACKMIVMMFDDLDYRESFKRTVERELVQVKRMLDDLRNVAKPVPLEKFPIDINKALAEVAESMQTSAASASLTLHTELVPGQLFIQGDLFALNRVYRNLITNAFQATAPQGSVTIRTTRDGTHAVVQIADTGSGIPAARLATIFDDFVTTKKRGLGLGLAISRKVVEQLDGTIAVASQVGQGTTFTLRFPLTKERPEQRAA